MIDIYNTPHLAGCGVPKRWDKADVIAEYDSNLNLTLAELSRKSRWSIDELKVLLNGGTNEQA